MLLEHECSGDYMFLEHQRNHALGTGTLVIVCSWNREVIMLWACMLGHRMLLKHERNYAVGNNDLVTIWS